MSPGLRDHNQIDLAEALFGTVMKGDKGETVTSRGRVAFEDAVWSSTGNAPFFERLSPKILGTPKATAFQEYLVQDHPNRKDALRHYGDSPDHTAIRGHKLYWHKRFDRRKYWEAKPVDAGTQHTVIRPVVPGTQFRGRVHFENLSNLELGALLAALKLPEDMRHKLGMGKPLGMGSVKITVQVKLIDRGKRYARLLADDGSLYTGEMPADQCDEICTSARKEFDEAIIAHYHTHGSCREQLSSGAGLWQIPRLSELALLLKWVPDRDDPRFDYPAPDQRTGGIDGRYWRERRVLPTPEGVINGSLRRGGGQTPSCRRSSPSFHSSPRQRPIPNAGAVSQGPAVGAVVAGILMAEKTKKGKWKVRLESGLQGVIIDSERVPFELQPDARVMVQIKSIGAPLCNFSWVGVFKG